MSYCFLESVAKLRAGIGAANETAEGRDGEDRGDAEYGNQDLQSETEI